MKAIQTIPGYFIKHYGKGKEIKIVLKEKRKFILSFHMNAKISHLLLFYFSDHDSKEFSCQING